MIDSNLCSISHQTSGGKLIQRIAKQLLASHGMFSRQVIWCYKLRIERRPWLLERQLLIKTKVKVIAKLSSWE